MSELPDVETAFRKALDSHGYGFQYAVLDRAKELRSTSKSSWVFEAAEFPVSVEAGSTRIDFILRQPDRRSYLIGECKRANPALSNWCFAVAPLVARNSIGNAYTVERVRPFHGEVRAESTAMTYADRAYHVALEIRTHQRGDSAGPGRGAIDDGVSQVLKGTNGFVNFLSSRPALVPENTDSMLLPVVFTTARLWASDAALDRADLSTGKIDFSGSSLIPVPWLVYQHFQSPELSHQVSGNRVDDRVSRVLEVDLMRSVAIVSSDGIEDYLRWSSQFAG